ncbi:MAG: hypothetical protein AAGC95_18430 [Pseudomonadota bacterium]
MLKAILLLSLFLVLPFSDYYVKVKFDKFCENNIPPLPKNLIATDGVEFRGDFNLGYLNWMEYADFVEFSTSYLRQSEMLDTEFKKPHALEGSMYRMPLFSEWGVECEKYWKLTNTADKDAISKQRNHVNSIDNAKCQGLTQVSNFSSEYIVEKIESDKYARILMRPVHAYIVRAFNRETGLTVAEFRRFTVSTSFLMSNIPYLPHGFRCRTDARPLYNDVHGFVHVFE